MIKLLWIDRSHDSDNRAAANISQTDLRSLCDITNSDWPGPHIDSQLGLQQRFTVCMLHLPIICDFPMVAPPINADVTGSGSGASVLW